MNQDPTAAEIIYFSDHGHMYMFRASLRWYVYQAYQQQVTPEESNFGMLGHVWDAMLDWCKNHTRGYWWTDHILGVAFKDEGDAIRFKLTFMQPNHNLNRMFTDRKHTYSEH